MELEELKSALFEKLKNGPVMFAYRKKDDSLRIAEGTTCLAEVPENLQPSGKIEASDASKRYYDIGSNGWRSFKPESLVWVDECAAISSATKEELGIIAEKCLPH